ncbi:restriction endonuclease [Streptomyces apricus]|uniref:Restriction endonuclease n=1 Tax=Streptomyces apricus TaxID=1828112 RepID=A0A5B0AQ69_9ACTN|nr:restriction endonuclease [Streptomyces apricus]KAA0931884.1 restriction endonuclease [Streptomyces apricus]
MEASTADSTVWDIAVGDVVKRIDLHHRYGGRRQGGIGPSRVSDNVFLFTDPIKGHKHGYFDGWGEDDCYHYAGEGQTGDQKMTQGNLAILKHKQEGRALRLFMGVSSGMCRYLGEFELPEERPWYRTDAPETNGGPVRSVIMFRLQPVSAEAPVGTQLPHTPASKPVVESIDVEAQHTERMLVDPSREPYEAERTEAKLVRAYADHLRLLGHSVSRHRIAPAGVAKQLLTDLYDGTANRLYEAKGSVSREAIRMAIGQLLDYARFLPQPELALLVPSQPEPDLLDLCSQLQIVVVWPKGEGYASTDAA